MVQGIPTSLLQQSQVQFTPAARPVRDGVAETATRGLLANLEPPYRPAANVHLRINLDPRY